MSGGTPKWDIPVNEASSKPFEAGDLARKHGISPDRAPMLIDRFGHAPEQLSAAAEMLQPKGPLPSTSVVRDAQGWQTRKGQQGRGGLVVAGRDGTGLLQLGHEAIHPAAGAARSVVAGGNRRGACPRSPTTPRSSADARSRPASQPRSATTSRGASGTLPFGSSQIGPARRPADGARPRSGQRRVRRVRPAASKRGVASKSRRRRSKA